MKVIFITAVCISLIFYAGEAFSESDEICYTWVNTKYVSSDRPQKIILSDDGQFVTYDTKASVNALQRGMFQVVKKWKDSEENIWYQIKMLDPKHETKYKLALISKDGNKLEFVCKSDKFPAEIDKNDPDYCTYMRASTY
jgi:hypothetical protein